MSYEILEEKIRQLTSEEQKEVLKFVDDFLSKRSIDLPEHKPGFKWAGGLEHLSNQYTSVELQKKINEWW